MRKKNKLWSYALAGALAISNLSGVVAMPFTTIVAQAADEIPYSAISITNTEAGIGENAELQIAVKGANESQTLYQQFVEYWIVNVNNASYTSFSASNEYAGLLNNGTFDASAVPTFTEKAGTLKTKIASKYAIDINTGVLTTKDATVGDVITVGAILRDSKNNNATACAGVKTFTVTAAAQNAWIDVGKSGALDANTNAITLNVHPTGTAVNTSDLLLTMYNESSKASTASLGINTESGGEFTVKYTLGNITNVAFAGNEKKTTVEVNGTVANNGNKVPDLILTDKGRELTSNETTTLEINATYTHAGKSWTKTQKVAVNLVAPVQFSMNSKYETYNGSDYSEEKSLDGEIVLPAGTGTKATLISVPSSGIDNSKLKATTTDASGKTNNIIVKFLKDGKYVAVNSGNGEKIKVATSLQTSKNYSNSSFPASAKDWTNNYYTVVFTGPSDPVDASETFQITTYGEESTDGTNYKNVTEVKVSIDNPTLEVEGVPTEMFVGEEFDLTTITAKYDGKDFDVKNITEWDVDGGSSIIAVDTKTKTDITAKGAGTAKLYVKGVKLDGNNTESASNANDAESKGFPVIEVTVNNKLDVSIDKTSVKVGETLDLSKASIKSGDTTIDPSAVDWKLSDSTLKDDVYTNDYASLEKSTLTGIAAGEVEVRAYLGTVTYGAVKITVDGSDKEAEDKEKEEAEQAKQDAIKTAGTAADTAVANPTDANIAALEKAIADAKAAGASDADVKAAEEKLTTALKSAKTNAEKAAADNKTAADNATKAADAAKKEAADNKTAADNATKAADAAKKEAADNKTAADTATKAAEAADAKLKLSTALTTNAGKTKKVSGTSFKTDADGGKSVAVTKGKNVKALTLKATVKIGGNTYKVRALNAKAFTGTKIRTIKIAGNYLTNVDVNAFKNTKATKITVTKASATAKKQLKAAAKAAKLTYSAKGKTVTITKK